jgi:phosphatidylinositol-3-phosphatase
VIKTNRRSRSLTVVVALLGIWLALASCGGSGSSDPIQQRPSPIADIGRGKPVRIAVIVMENEEFGDVVGSRHAPFVRGLARRYALASKMFAVSHPSLPNYLALTGGSTAGIDSDCTDCSVSGSGIAGQLSRKGISWRAYMEDLPQPCFKGAGLRGYAKKHDPFVYYRGVAASRALCENVVPLTRLRGDERRRQLPRFAWITPNLCHDMHDCGVSVGDRFLGRTVPVLLRALGPRGLLVLTWDEGSSDSGCCRFASGGHVATILAGPAARAGARLGTATDHYSVLQMIEDLFGLRRLAHAGCACTPTLQPLLAKR